MRTWEEVFRVTPDKISNALGQILFKISDRLTEILEESFWRDLQSTLERELCGETMNSTELENAITATFLATDEIETQPKDLVLQVMKQESTIDVSQN